MAILFQFPSIFFIRFPFRPKFDFASHHGLRNLVALSELFGTALHREYFQIMLKIQSKNWNWGTIAQYAFSSRNLFFLRSHIITISSFSPIRSDEEGKRVNQNLWQFGLPNYDQYHHHQPPTSAATVTLFPSGNCTF